MGWEDPMGGSWGLRGHGSRGGPGPCYPCLHPHPQALGGQEATGWASPHPGHEFCLFSALWGTNPITTRTPFKVMGFFYGMKGAFPLAQAGEGSALLVSFRLGERRGPIRPAPPGVIYCSNKERRSSG